MVERIDKRSLNFFFVLHSHPRPNHEATRLAFGCMRFA